MFIKNPLSILNFAVLLQQQRYMVAISYLFYLHNGLNLTDFLLFQSVFYFTGLLCEIPAGYIGDIFPKKNVLIFSYLLFTVRILLWIFIPNYYTLLLGEILFGLSKAFYRGVSDSYIYDYLRQNNLSELMLNKYGKFNFFMSTGSAISCLLGVILFESLGFKVILSLELICNLVAVGVLCLIPQILVEKKHLTFKVHLQNIYGVVKDTVTNSKLNLHILYNGILVGMTSVLVYNFQPFLKSLQVPVIFFGLIYFVNHIIRAIFSGKAYKFISLITLQKTGVYSYLGYLISFIVLFLFIDTANQVLGILILLFICLAIGVQMVYNVGNLSRIHHKITLKPRATISSFNSMVSSFMSGTFLLIFKSLVEGFSIKMAIGYFFVLLCFAIITVPGLFIKIKE